MLPLMCLLGCHLGVSLLAPLCLTVCDSPHTLPAASPSLHPCQRLSMKITPVATCQHTANVCSIAATSNFAWVYSGGQDGVIRKFDFFGSLHSGGRSSHPPKGALADINPKPGVLLNSWDAVEDPTGADIEDVSPVSSLCVQHSGMWALSGFRNGHVALWSLRVDEGSRQYVFNNHSRLVTSVVACKDEKSFLSSSLDGSLAQTDLNTGKCAVMGTLPSDILVCIKHPIEDYFCTASSDGCLRLWDMRAATAVRCIISGDVPISLDWCPSGLRLYAGMREGNVFAWDLRTSGAGRNLCRPSSTPVSLVKVIARGNHLLVGSSQGMVCYHLANGENAPVEGPMGVPILAATSNAVGTLLAIATGSQVGSGSKYEKSALLYAVEV